MNKTTAALNIERRQQNSAASSSESTSLNDGNDMARDNGSPNQLTTALLRTYTYFWKENKWVEWVLDLRYRPTMLKQMNESRVLRLVRETGEISKTDISKSLHLGMSTTMRLVDSLIENGFLVAKGTGTSTGGRPPSIVGINTSSMFALGLELGRQTTRIVLLNLLGSIHESASIATEEVDEPRKIIPFIRNFLLQSTVDESAILGIGVAVPGPFDSNTGSILNLVDFPHSWSNAPIERLISEEFGFKCYLANNADVAALSEVWSGGRNSSDGLMFVLGEMGFGMGLVLNGQIWSGHSNAAGELAHVIVDMEGEKCTCGKQGCLNTYSSVGAIQNALRKKLGKSENFRDFLQKAEQRHEPEYSIAKTALQALQTAVMSTIAIVDPEEVVLGGQYMLDAAALAPNMFNKMVVTLHEGTGKNVTLTNFDVMAVALGAGMLVLYDIYDHTYVLK
ncbi:ROK family transcriptional regulator [Alicyclobacillus sp. SO9]|uniref:ROK family transcriptional regulator n=1 Tax=Alicyclobacillus sp. SO9 TaxID=2665646 RepID=UPI0018E75B8B|nr:ROK family transcriptional regulator [Alicyclobacillus sp. SO9]QQE77942.1 ROK family transcriptional regulator [Alicyclobacillus sp. SO9]